MGESLPSVMFGEHLLIWWLRVPFGWIIPIVVLIALSFPPLFGHEIVGVLCGVVGGAHHFSKLFSLGAPLGLGSLDRILDHECWYTPGRNRHLLVSASCFIPDPALIIH